MAPEQRNSSDDLPRGQKKDRTNSLIIAGILGTVAVASYFVDKKEKKFAKLQALPVSAEAATVLEAYKACGNDLVLPDAQKMTDEYEAMVAKGGSHRAEAHRRMSAYIKDLVEEACLPKAEAQLDQIISLQSAGLSGLDLRKSQQKSGELREQVFFLIDRLKPQPFVGPALEKAE